MYKLLKSDSESLCTQHNYSTQTRDNLQIAKHSLSLFKHSLSYSGPKIWNAMPDEVKNASTLCTLFQKQI